MTFGLRAVFAVNWSRVPMADCRVGTTIPQLVRLRGHMGICKVMGMVLSHYAAWVFNGVMPSPNQPHIGCGDFSDQRFFKTENSFWGGDFTAPLVFIPSCCVCHLLEQSLRACCSSRFFVFAAARTHQLTRSFFLSRRRQTYEQ
jgi:hypothetical protein